MAVLSPPDLGAERGLVFPTMHVGQREYRADEVPAIALEDLAACVRAELAVLRGRIDPAGGWRSPLAVGALPTSRRSCARAAKRSARQAASRRDASDGQPRRGNGRGSARGAGGLRDDDLRRSGMPIALEYGRPADRPVDDMPVFYELDRARGGPHPAGQSGQAAHRFSRRRRSGLAKICAIGLGKQRGAQTIHSYGTRGLAELMPRRRAVHDRDDRSRPGRPGRSRECLRSNRRDQLRRAVGHRRGR